MSKARDLANAGTALTTVSATELGYLDGVTSAVQTQLDGKQAANANVSTTELGYLDGVTSAIQTQLNAKEPTLPSQTGNSGKYLTTDGTNKSWGTISAGGMTLLSTTTLSGASTTISGIDQTYNNLYIRIYGVNLSAAAGVYMRINGTSNLCTYVVYLPAIVNWESTTTGDWQIYGKSNGSGDQLRASNTSNAALITIDNYASTTAFKPMFGNMMYASPNVSASTTGGVTQGGVVTNSAVTSLQIHTSSGTFNGGTVQIYGVK